MKTLLFVLALLSLTGCDHTETEYIPERYEHEGVTMYTVHDGIVFEYRNFFLGKITSDTLLLQHNVDQINGILFWPPPYTLNFTRK